MIVQSAVVIYAITPTVDTLSKDNIQQILEIIFFSSIFSPLLRFANLEYRFKARAHAPYARECELFSNRQFTSCSDVCLSSCLLVCAANFQKQKSFFAPVACELGEYFAQNNCIFFVVRSKQCHTLLRVANLIKSHLLHCSPVFTYTRM
jgi:hypothetical protein